MTTYSDLNRSAQDSQNELIEHRQNGANAVTAILTEALSALGGPERWWNFDRDYAPHVHVFQTQYPGVFMEQSSGTILCRLCLRFGSALIPYPELDMPVRAKALAGGAIEFVMYEDENTGGAVVGFDRGIAGADSANRATAKLKKLKSVVTFTPGSEPEFRASLYKAIEEALSAFRPPGHPFAKYPSK